MSTKKTSSEKTGKKRVMEIVNTGGGEWWKPAEGEVLKGTLVRMDKNVGGKYGEKNPKTGKREQDYGVVLNEATDLEINLPSTHVLNDFFLGNEEKETKPCKLGTYLEITYKGRKLKKGKKEGSTNDKDYYHDYLIAREVVK